MLACETKTSHDHRVHTLSFICIVVFPADRKSVARTKKDKKRIASHETPPPLLPFFFLKRFFFLSFWEYLFMLSHFPPVRIRRVLSTRKLFVRLYILRCSIRRHTHTSLIRIPNKSSLRVYLIFIFLSRMKRRRKLCSWAPGGYGPAASIRLTRSTLIRFKINR